MFSISTNITGLGYKVLYPFTGTSDGGNPRGKLISVNGLMYGTASDNGINNAGNLFSVKANPPGLTVLYPFSETEGGEPNGGVITNGGKMWGTTSQGGSAGQGTVFSIDLRNPLSTFTTVHSFSGDDGAAPQSGLVAYGSSFYGTTAYGGAKQAGTLFSIDANGNYTVLHNFANSPEGAVPLGSLVRLGDTLYGTTSFGGSYGFGTVFACKTNGGIGAFRTLYSFNNSLDGAIPAAELTGSNGLLYGTTYGGGLNGYGTVFSVSTNGDLTVLYLFSGGADGGNPQAGLISSGSTLYGTAVNGGTNSSGTLFAFSTLPVIATQPSSTNVSSGGTASFTVGASGVPPLGYQWRLNGKPLVGQTNSTMVLTAVSNKNTGVYSVTVYDPYGSVTSVGASLTVLAGKPMISDQPQSAIVNAGQTATLGVLAYGSLPLRYQWWFGNTPLTGYTNSSVSFTASTPNAGSYFVVITNTFGSVTSRTASVWISNGPPVIVAQPANVVVPVWSHSASFGVTAYGTWPLSYQWITNGTISAGGTDAVFTVPFVTTNSAKNYMVLVSNSGGTVTSRIAQLSLMVPPLLNPTLPQDQTVTLGESVQLTVDAWPKSPAPAYQWRFNGSPISGQSGSSLSIVTTTNVPGNYSVVVTNAAGSMTSRVAVVTLNAPRTSIVLHNFGVIWDGLNPYATLVQSGNTLFGTTVSLKLLSRSFLTCLP